MLPHVTGEFLRGGADFIFPNPQPLACFAGLCGSDSWKPNVRLQHSLLVAFHYEIEEDRRLTSRDLHQESGWFGSSGSGRKNRREGGKRKKKTDSAMNNASPCTLRCILYGCAEIACGHGIAAFA